MRKLHSVRRCRWIAFSFERQVIFPTTKFSVHRDEPATAEDSQRHQKADGRESLPLGAETPVPYTDAHIHFLRPDAQSAA